MNSHVRELTHAGREGLERDLANMKEGLGLLGIRPCSFCGKFFRSSGASETFSFSGEIVCYDCLGAWWVARSPELDLATRGAFEQKLMRWLIDNYDARVIRDPSRLPSAHNAEFRLVVTCRECSGSGVLGNVRCRHCRGNKTIWVIVPRKHA